MIEIKNNICKWRLKREMSQRDLARASGVSQAHISNLERSRRSATIETLLMLAKALDAKVGELVTVTEDGFRTTFKYF